MTLQADLRIISGAQTGADRGGLYGALDAAKEGAPVEVGGWVPLGFKAEDGSVPKDLQGYLRETDSTDYPRRTELNVKESDATLVCFNHRYGTGTAKTLAIAMKAKKPVVLVYFAANKGSGTVFVSTGGGPLGPASARGVALHERVTEVLGNIAGLHVLNVAGPRESHSHGLEARVRVFVRDVLLARYPYFHVPQ